MKIAAIILAAGESCRMGSPKALLHVHKDGPNFLSHLLNIFEQSRANYSVVVLGYHAERIRMETDLRKAAVTTNTAPERGMLSSIQTGILALNGLDVAAAFVCPVDHPDLAPWIVDDLISNFEITGAPVVVPVFQERRGHPVLFSKEVFPDLLAASETVGARQVVWQYEKNLFQVSINAPGVTQDIDTPEEYRRWSSAKNSI